MKCYECESKLGKVSYELIVPYNNDPYIGKVAGRICDGKCRRIWWKSEGGKILDVCHKEFGIDTVKIHKFINTFAPFFNWKKYRKWMERT